MSEETVVRDLNNLTLGHNHTTREVKTVGLCKRCDYVRGMIALGR